MSHFTRVRTKLKDRDILISTLREMGYLPESDPKGAEVTVRGWAGSTRKAEIKVAKGDFDIGFAKDGDSYTAFGDFSSMQMSETAFAHELNRRYACATLKAAAIAEGFQVVEEVPQADGSLKLVVERWA